MRVFITGASGFIGQALTKELIGAGHTVLGLARSDKAAEELKAIGAEVQRGSLEDLDALKEGASKSDGVVHLAFVHDFANYSKSCEIDRNVITAIGEVLAGTNRPFILTTGTMSLAHGRLGTEEDAHDASLPVFADRGRSEILLGSLTSKGIRTIIMRPASVIHGENDTHMFMSVLINTARAQGSSAYIGEGQNHWPAAHVKDTAVAYRLALEKAKAGSRFHVVAELPKVKDIAEVVGEKLGLPVVSKSVEEAEGQFGPFWFIVAADNIVSWKKTEETLGWKAKEVTLLEDLRDGPYFKA